MWQYHCLQSYFLHTVKANLILVLFVQFDSMNYMKAFSATVSVKKGNFPHEIETLISKNDNNYTGQTLTVTKCVNK